MFSAGSDKWETWMMHGKASVLECGSTQWRKQAKLILKLGELVFETIRYIESARVNLVLIVDVSIEECILLGKE